MKNILVLCTGNSCRSQIAHGYLEHFADKNVKVFSAGLETHGVNPNAIKTMAADGVDISKNTSNNLTEYLHISFDFIITVCDNANENCPYFPGNAKRLHYNFPDPAKAIGSTQEIENQFATVRDQIKDYCKNFVDTELS